MQTLYGRIVTAIAKDRFKNNLEAKIYIQNMLNKIIDWGIQIEATLLNFKSFEHMKFQLDLENLKRDIKGKQVMNTKECNLIVNFNRSKCTNWDK